MGKCSQASQIRQSARDRTSTQVACGLTGVTLFTLGAVKARITGRRWFLSGFEVFVVGGLAAVAAYVIGLLLSGLV